MAEDKFPMSIPTNVKLINEESNVGDGVEEDLNIGYGVVNDSDWWKVDPDLWNDLDSIWTAPNLLDGFPPDFKEYMLRELTWDWQGIGCVFWSRQDDEPDPRPRLSLTLYDRPNVKDHRIRDALQTMISFPELGGSLVQFWAATTTLEGRTLLTTQNQPFALCSVYDPIGIKGLCEYRMISKESIFYGDLDSEEKELGLPGRVFLHKFPISAPNVHYYSIKEYPQREDALRCDIISSLVVPVFEQFGQICVGVLELVSLVKTDRVWYAKSFVGRLCDVFQIHQLHLSIPLQKLGLQCFDAFKHMQYKDENKALTVALHELSMVMESVCRMHELPLALTWVPCCKCNDLLRGQLLGKGVGYSDRDGAQINFLKVSESRHLRRKQVAGWALSFPHLVYCSDVCQFSSADYPLVHYARDCSLSGWFAIGLQSSFTGNDVYLLEFFLPNKECENSRTLLTKILGTMKESFKTFKLASGQELGEELPVKVVYFNDGQTLHSVQYAGRSLQPPIDAINQRMSIISSEQDNFSLLVISSEKEGIIRTQESQHKKIPLEDILRCSNMSREDASRKLGVRMPTFKRYCRDHGITLWSSRNIGRVSPTPPLHAEHQEGFPQSNSVLPSSEATVAGPPPVTIKAKYEVDDVTIKFQLSLSSGLIQLQQQVAERLEEAQSYDIKYKDVEGNWILISCDEDLRRCIQTATSLGNTTIELLLQPEC